MLELGQRMYWTRRQLVGHGRAIGLEAGDAVMVHAALRKIGPMVYGPDTLIDAILDAIGVDGTLVCYVSWEENYEAALDGQGRLAADKKADIAPFDPARSRACRDHGALAEFIRTTPFALRSANPGASVAAIGKRAAWIVADHPLDYGYGEGSPFAKLLELNGKVLMIGAPLDTMSLLHHAEHLARIPNKRIRRMEIPLAVDDGVEWRMIEEFDTTDPVIDGLEDAYFATIVDEFLSRGCGRRRLIGSAASVLVPAADIVAFAVSWLEMFFPTAQTPKTPTNPRSAAEPEVRHQRFGAMDATGGNARWGASSNRDSRPSASSIRKRPA